MFLPRKLSVGIFLLTAILPFLLTAAQLDDVLENKDVWEISQDEFIQGRQKQFSWLDKGRSSCRYPAFSNSGDLSCFGLKVWEALLRFDSDRLAQVEISFYNRGDAGDLNEDRFDKKLSEVRGKIESFIGNEGESLADERLAGNKAKIESKFYLRGDTQFILRWSTTGRRNDFRAEYIQLLVSKFDRNNDPRNIRRRSDVVAERREIMLTPEELKAKVVRQDDGTVFISDVPMVDQGQKGYCAVACSERVLRHFGTEVDQHVIAQLADTSTDGGTDPAAMFAMLKKAGVKFGVRLKGIHEFDSRKVRREVGKYNRLAKKAGKPEIDIRGIRTMDQIYMGYDPETYMEYRCEKESRSFERFLKDVREYIDEGIPVAWSVYLGIFPEPDIPQARGGHMRLIIGYNDKTEEIIYSDSWGAQHAFKKMPMTQAWTITTGAAAMISRKR